MRLSLVLHTVGHVLRLFGFLLLIPLVTDLLYGGFVESIGFLIAGVTAVAGGHQLVRLHAGGEELRRMEGIGVVAAVWLGAAIVGAIPYVWSGLGVVDALFESMSGFTTTGATIFRDFSDHSRGLFLWRAFTQWLGGIGVIALVIAVLPRLAIAGRQMFFAEAPGPQEERLTPRIRNTAIALWSLYVGLTAFEVLLLVLSGMPLYHAICNSFATLAAGGFSPHPESIGGYGNPLAEWIVLVFMFLAGANYLLQYRAIRGRPAALAKDEEFRTYVGIVLVASVLLGLALAGRHGWGFFDVARHSAFQVLSIVTTTGFATDDFAGWSERAKVILLVLMFVGGSAGSAGGGPKVVRMLLIFKYAGAEVVRALHPQVVRPVRLNGRTVPASVMQSIVSFFLLYLLIYVASVVIVVLLGADLMTAITACIATLGNIGPGFGAVGPMASYADFPALSKLVLFMNMWIGRLEVMTVILLLQPSVWRTARWRE